MDNIYPSRWAPQYPDRLQLYSLPTPNGRKVGVALEEIGLPYEAHKIDIMKGDQDDPEFRRISPNGKIPVIIDPEGPNGKPIPMMESAAILLYLAHKTGKLMPSDEVMQWQVRQWLFFQVGHVGPMFGQFGHFFMYAKGKTSDTYAVERYTKETTRLLGVLNDHLQGREFLVGDAYTIADVATFPWIDGLNFYKGTEAVGYGKFKAVHAWMQRCMSRPATERGFKIAS